MKKIITIRIAPLILTLLLTSCENAMDIKLNSGALIDAPPEEVPIPDTTPPVILGLINLTESRFKTTWNWSCSENPCSYRHLISTNSVETLTGSYDSIATASIKNGTGTYYIHVQARDAAGNESTPVSFSVTLQQRFIVGTGRYNSATESWDMFYGSTLDSDDRIVAVGLTKGGPGYNNDSLVIRRTSDGALDSTFGTNGIAVFDFISASSEVPNCVATQADNKIVVAGFANTGSRGFVARLNENGTIDTSFGTNGVYLFATGDSTEFRGITIDSAQNILVTGYHNNGGASNARLVVARLTPSGALDTSFSGDGLYHYAVINEDVLGQGIAIDQNGKIIVGGLVTTGFASYGDSLVIRLETNGALDTSYGVGGISVIDHTGFEVTNAIHLYPDGSVLLAGIDWDSSFMYSDFYLTKLQSNGALDTTFGNSGLVLATNPVGGVDEIRSIKVANNGSIYAAGYAHQSSVVLKFTSTGSLDTTFDTDGMLISLDSGTQSSFESILILPDQSLVASGSVYKNGATPDAKGILSLQVRINP